MHGESDENRIGTGIVPYAGAIEEAALTARVHHDSSYVTQLIAEAAGLPQMPRRRRLERWEAVVAYVAAEAATSPRPDRVRRSA